MVADDRMVDHFRRRLLSHLGKIRFEKWFEGRTSVQIEGDLVTIGVASPFLMKWMIREFQAPGTLAAQECLGPSAHIRFEVCSTAEQLSATYFQERAQVQESNPEPSAEKIESISKPENVREPLRKSSVMTGGLAPRRRRFASLDDFVSGQGNNSSLQIAKVISRHPGESYNPFYLYGGVGVGKTHLLEGIHREVKANFPDWQVLSLTAEAFGNYYTKALYEKSLPAFRKRFRAIDVLIVDDVDFLDAKKGFQEEFCHTIQELISYGRQVVLSADRHPKMLSNIRPELSTRFLSGILSRLESPDYETRMEIVRRRAEKMSLPVTDDAIEYVANRFSRNVRELIGAINCLQTYHQMTKRMIGITATREVLRDLERDCLKIVRTSDIQHAICNLFGIKQDELVSSRRSRHLSQPRMLAMYLARQWTAAAYHEIGKQFGGRNHSTVMSAEKRIRNMIEKGDSIQVSTRAWNLRDVISTLGEELQVG